MKKKNVWIPLIAIILLAVTVLGVFSLLSNNLMNSAKRIQNKVENSVSTDTDNASGNESDNGSDDNSGSASGGASTDYQGPVELAMISMNSYYYALSSGSSIYTESMVKEYKETIYTFRFQEEFLTAPTRNSNGELSTIGYMDFPEGMSYFDKLDAMSFQAVLEDYITITVGQTVEVECLIDPFEPYFGVPILLGDSTEYFTTKDGKITGVAPCENVPLHVSICGLPYTVYITVK